MDKRKERSVISKEPHVKLKFSRNVGVRKLSLSDSTFHPLASAIQILSHLKPLFEAFKENYWIDIRNNLRYHKTIIQKLVRHLKPYQKS